MTWTASDFERLDPKLFRGFLAVVHAGSFNEAAKFAHLSQGAISQQVGKLEEKLGVQLFRRGPQSIKITDEGKKMARFAEDWLAMANSFAEKLGAAENSTSGAVSYSMPESCIHSPHFSMLMEKRKFFPKITLNIELKPSSEVYSDLMRGQIDFGFLTEPIQNDLLELYPFCSEEYCLVAQPGLFTPVTNPTDLQHIHMINYPGHFRLLDHWSLSLWPQANERPALGELTIMGSFNDIRGALAMVKGGMGAAIFPNHVVGHLLETGEIVKLTPPSLPTVLQQIHIARLKHRYLPSRVKLVIKWFLEMHTDLQPVPSDFLDCPEN